MKLSSFFKKYTLALGIVCAMTLFGAFSILWMRKQVSLQSYYGQRLEKEFAHLCRRMHHLNLCIAHLQSATFLKKHCAQNLMEPKARQTIWLPKQTMALAQSKLSSFPTVAMNKKAR